MTEEEQEEILKRVKYTLWGIMQRMLADQGMISILRDNMSPASRRDHNVQDGLRAVFTLMFGISNEQMDEFFEQLCAE